MKDDSLSLIYGFLAVFIWSTVSTAFKIALQFLNFWNLLLFASFSSLIFFLGVSIFRRTDIKVCFTGRVYKHMVMGFINPFLYYIVLFGAYSRLPAQIAQPLNYTWPIWLAILSKFVFKEKLGFKTILGILAGFIGVWIISGGKAIDGNLLGIILALTSAIIWAFFWILNVKDESNSVLKMMCNFLFGFLYILIFLIFFLKINFNFKGIISSVYVGLFEMGVTFLIWERALRLSSSKSRISILIFLVPFLSLIWISIILKEKIEYTTFLGLIFIIGGILFGMQREKSMN